MTKARSNAVANAAKGDLTVGNGTNLSGILAVGSNGDTLVADSSTSTGLSWQPTKATQNFCIGGGFDIWQRGTSFTTSSFIYTADRWYQEASVSTTSSQQTTGAPNGARYVYRMELGATGGFSLKQVIETANTVNLQGKTITYSFLIRKNATYDADVIFSIAKNSTVDAGITAAGWTAMGSTATIPNASLPTGTTSTDWYQASVTINVPNDGTANSLRLRIASSTLTVPSGAYLEVALVQVEVGSTRTNFNRAGGTIQGELAACQRYYVSWNRDAAVSDAGIATGFASSTTSARIYVPLPVRMRTTPTTVDWTASGLSLNEITAGYTVSTLAFTNQVNNAQTAAFNATVASGLTQWRPYFLNVQTTTAFGIGAEL
jgi:hypothetical protein